MKLEEAPVIGKVPPASDGVDAPFWGGLNEGEVRIQRCRSCARWQWPSVWRCPDCGGWAFGWEAVVAEGVVFSWKVPRHDGGDHSQRLMMDLDAPGFRILGDLHRKLDGCAVDGHRKSIWVTNYRSLVMSPAG